MPRTRLGRPEDTALTLDDFRPAEPGRRQEPRTTLRKQVWVFAPPREPRIGHLADCSPHGVGLLLAEGLAERQEFSLKLQIPRVRLVTYSVRYCRPEAGQFRVGALVCGVDGKRGHPDLEVVFRALLEVATAPVAPRR